MDRINDILNHVKEELSAKEKLDVKTTKSNDEEYKESFYEMSVGSLRAIMEHAKDILENLESDLVKENLTAPHLQGIIAVAEDHMRSIHDFVMYVQSNNEEDEEDNEEMSPNDMIKTESNSYDDTNALKNMIEIYGNIHEMLNEVTDPIIKERLTKAMKNARMMGVVEAMRQFQDILMFLPLGDDDKTMIASSDKPGLWENIRKKRERMGKNYKPAKPGDKGRPDPEQWKKLTK
jgi:hypothetical protein